MKPKHLDRPQVAGCSTGHKSHLLHFSGWVSVILGSYHADVCSSVHLSVKFDFNQLCEAIKTCAQLLIGSDRCIGGNCMVPTAQTLAPNDVKITRWQLP